MRWWLAPFAVLIAGCGGGGHSAELRDGLQPVVAAGVPGALAYVRDGDHTEYAAIGIAPDSRFRIGSVTKTFVATIVLQLVAAGEQPKPDHPGDRQRCGDRQGCRQHEARDADHRHGR